MKTKWYLSTFVVALVFLGICQHRISAPNQEVLLQFNPDEVTTEQSQNAVDAVVQQLQTFGIEDVQIHQNGNGELRISYHSSIAVESIKKALSEKALHFDIASVERGGKDSKKTSGEQDTDYLLDVYELHKTSESNNSAGKFVIVVKQDYDRYLNSNFYPSFNQLGVDAPKNLDLVPNKADSSNAVAMGVDSHTIPEVRAGPVVSPNS